MRPIVMRRAVALLAFATIFVVVPLLSQAAFSAPDGGIGLDSMVASTDAAAATAPQAPDVGALVSLLFTLVKGGKWGLVAAVGIMLLVIILSRLPWIRSRIPDKYLPWVSIGLGVGAGLITALATGAPWVSALTQWVTYALAASGLYSAGAKKLPGAKRKPPAA